MEKVFDLPRDGVGGQSGREFFLLAGGLQGIAAVGVSRTPVERVPVKEWSDDPAEFRIVDSVLSRK